MHKNPENESPPFYPTLSLLWWLQQVQLHSPFQPVCYKPVRELRSTSFSVIPVIPVTSPSPPSLYLCTVHYRLSSSFRLSSFVFPSFVFRLSSIPLLRIYSAPFMFRASFLGFVARLSYFNIFTFLWLDNKLIVFVIL